MGTTKIEWADAVWNPVTGCTKVSPGCANCYAERMAKRLAHIEGSGYGDGAEKPDAKTAFRVSIHPDRLGQPLHWRKPRRVFVCSMGDLFHEDVPPHFVAHVFGVMAACKDHTFMVLTKRPHRINAVFGSQEFMEEFMVGYSDYGQRLTREDAMAIAVSDCGRVEYPVDPVLPLKNVWLGVSVENQAAADERIPLLLRTPAAVRFVSVESMLGPVDIEPFISVYDRHGEPSGPRCNPDGSDALGWVICGGESGPGARPMNPAWPRSLRDQCQAAGVPFFFKHWGEWAPGWRAGEALAEGRTIHPNCRVHKWGEGEAASWSWRIGKKAAGRLLDGREWNEWPVGE